MPAWQLSAPIRVRGITGAVAVAGDIAHASALTSATLAGPSNAPVATDLTYTVTLNADANQTFRIQLTCPGATVTPSSYDITAGNRVASFTVQGPSPGSYTVDFDIIVGPALARVGRPISLTLTSEPSDLPANTITTGTTASVGVTYGQAFKRGAVASGASLLSRQLNVVTTWDDGSCRIGIVSRIVSGATSYTETLAIGTAATGATLGTADLPSGIRTTGVTITAGGYGSVSWTGAAWDVPVQTWFTGPVCSSWVYRKPLPSDTHLVAWLEVRLWSNGQVEVFPWIENAYLNVANPVSKSAATFTFTMGGTLRFSQSIVIAHHTKIPLITGTVQPYYLGADPTALVAHQGSYLAASKVIPNIGGWGAPSSAVLDARQQTYTPNTLANDSNATGGTGGAGSIISEASAHYVTSNADARAYRGMMAHALSAGSWSLHYRDATTHLPPVYASYASNSIGDATIPAGTGATNHSGGPAMTHMPGYVYVPFIVTGRWWFFDEVQLMATWGFISVSPAYRGNGTPAIDTGSGYTVRGGAWSMNLAAQAAAVTPSTHALYAQFVATWERTTAKLYGKYVSGTLEGGAWVSPIGVLGSYSGDVGAPSLYSPPNPSSAWWDGAWQHNYIAGVLGYTSDMGIPQSAGSLANHTAVRNHSYKLVIGRADDGMNGRYNWRRFIAYGLPIGTDSAGLPVETHYQSHDQAYAELVAGWGLASNLPSNVGLTLKQHSSDADLTSGDSSRAYGSTALAALAMAVEHGAPGASEGYERITGASNYSSALTTWLSDYSPNWGVKPRAFWPAPAAGTISDLVTTPTLLTMALGHNGNFVNAFGGVTVARGLGAAGSILFAGGGHGDGGYNSIGRLDIATLTFSVVKDAAPIFNKVTNTAGQQNPTGLYCADTLTGWMWANGVTDETTVTVGEPAAVHAHSNIIWLPEVARPGYSATNGWVFQSVLGGFYETGQRSNNGMFLLRVGDSLYSKVGAENPTDSYLSYFAFGGYSHAYDPKRDVVWQKLEHTTVGSGTAGLAFAQKNPRTGTRTGVTFTTGATQGAAVHLSEYLVLTYSARHDLLINLAGVNHGSYRDYVRVFVYDPATQEAFEPAQTGTVPTTLLDSTARCWSDVWNAAAFFNGDGTDAFVHFLKPTGNPRTAPWVWSKQAITGTIRTVQAPQSPGENRLQHIPAIGNVLLWFARDQYPPQIISVNAP